MGMDLNLYLADIVVLFVIYGGYESFQVGIFCFFDGGVSFQLVLGLFIDYFGKVMLSISFFNLEIIYIFFVDVFESWGFYKFEDGGNNWGLINIDDIVWFQGWYFYDVVVKLDNLNIIIYIGVDLFKFVDGGVIVVQKVFWFKWFFGQILVGGLEGFFDYVYVDIYVVYYFFFDNNMVFVVIDGGVFVFEDNGEFWFG